MKNGMSFQESKTIVDKKTTVKLIVKRLATLQDLNEWRNNFVVPIDGGHVTATIVAFTNKVYVFKLCTGETTVFTSLENIYVL